MTETRNAFEYTGSEPLPTYRLAEDPPPVPDSQRYITTGADFTFCRDCGSLIMEGYRAEHDRMHPPISCDRLNCGVYHHPDGMHPWESVYPRTPDGRAGERPTP